MANELNEGVMRQPVRSIVLASEAAGDATPPGRILVVPWGEVVSENGEFVVDAESARLTIEAFVAHGTDLPIDYEHQSLGGAYSSPNGQAPAAGWIKRLTVVEPGALRQAQGASAGAAGLWAEVEWTEPAREQLAARQYRYLSPVALIRREDRRMVALHSAALTNKPAIVRMRPVVNRAGAGAAGVEPWDELRAMLVMDERFGETEVVAAAVERIRALTALIDGRAAAERVQAALNAGKLTAGQREWAHALALRDPAGFEEWAKHAPVVVVPGRTTPPGRTLPEKSREAIVARAKREYRAAGRFISTICTEEAFVADAIRRAGVVE